MTPEHEHYLATRLGAAFAVALLLVVAARIAEELWL